jgi:hypothetical protein
LLGFLLGWLGTMIQITPYMRAGLQIAIGVFMIGMALRMLNIHPIFLHFIIEPPKKIRTTIDSKYSEIFKDINSLANDYADASRKALHLNNITDARMFIDEAMRLLTDFEVDVPEEFVNLNTEILAKLPAD